jgi:hypothetical protein
MIFIHKYSTGDLTMLHHIKKLFGIKPKAVEAEVPYKVETPAPTPIAEQATQAVVESIAKPAKKTAAKKAPAAKKPRAPKKPKAE